MAPLFVAQNAMAIALFRTVMKIPHVASVVKGKCSTFICEEMAASKRSAEESDHGEREPPIDRAKSAMFVCGS
jgi:hypothetical protein